MINLPHTFRELVIDEIQNPLSPATVLSYGAISGEPDANGEMSVTALGGNTYRITVSKLDLNDVEFIPNGAKFSIRNTLQLNVPSYELPDDLIDIRNFQATTTTSNFEIFTFETSEMVPPYERSTIFVTAYQPEGANAALGDEFQCLILPQFESLDLQYDKRFSIFTNKKLGGEERFSYIIPVDTGVLNFDTPALQVERYQWDGNIGVIKARTISRELEDISHIGIVSYYIESGNNSELITLQLPLRVEGNQSTVSGSSVNNERVSSPPEAYTYQRPKPSINTRTQPVTTPLPDTDAPPIIDKTLRGSESKFIRDSAGFAIIPRHWRDSEAVMITGDVQDFIYDDFNGSNTSFFEPGEIYVQAGRFIRVSSYDANKREITNNIKLAVTIGVEIEYLEEGESKTLSQTYENIGKIDWWANQRGSTDLGLNYNRDQGNVNPETFERQYITGGQGFYLEAPDRVALFSVLADSVRYQPQKVKITFWF